MPVLPIKKRYAIAAACFLVLLLFGSAVASRNNWSSYVPESLIDFVPFLSQSEQQQDKKVSTQNLSSEDWVTPPMSSYRLQDTPCPGAVVIEGATAEKYAEGGDLENSIKTTSEGNFFLPSTNRDVQMVTVVSSSNQVCLLGYSLPKTGEGLLVTSRTTAYVAAFPSLFEKSSSEAQTILDNLSTLPSFTKFLLHLETQLPKRTLTELASEQEYPGLVVPIIQEYEERYGEVNF